MESILYLHTPRKQTPHMQCNTFTPHLTAGPLFPFSTPQALQRPARRVQQEEDARVTAARNEREVDSDHDEDEEDERGALNGGGRGRGGGGGGKRLGTVSQRTGLLYGMESAGGRDVESNEVRRV